MHRPGWRPSERFSITKKEKDGLREQPEIANDYAQQKKTEAANDRRKQKTFLDRSQRGKNKSRDKVEQQRKRDDDSGIKGEVKGDHDRVSNAERFERADLWIDIVERRLHHPYQQRAKGEADEHRENQSDRHFNDRPSQVFQMLEKRFRGFAFRQFAKLKDVAQGHALINARPTR